MIKKNGPVLSEFIFWGISDETHCILLKLVILLDISAQVQIYILVGSTVILIYVVCLLWVVNFLMMDCGHCRNCYLF